MAIDVGDDIGGMGVDGVDAQNGRHGIVVAEIGPFEDLVQLVVGQPCQENDPQQRREDQQGHAFGNGHGL